MPNQAEQETIHRTAHFASDIFSEEVDYLGPVEKTELAEKIIARVNQERGAMPNKGQAEQCFREWLNVLSPWLTVAGRDEIAAKATELYVATIPPDDDLPLVQGRRPKFVEAIVPTQTVIESGRYRLSKDGQWVHIDDIERNSFAVNFVWPREDAIAFVNKVAGERKG